MDYDSRAEERSFWLLKLFHLVQRAVKIMKLNGIESAIQVSDLGIRCALFLI